MWLLPVLVAGVILRAVLAARHELTFDESYRFITANASWPDLWRESERLLGGNVLYPALLKLLGLNQEESAWTFLPGLLAFCAGAGLAYVTIQRWLGPRPAKVVVMLLALSPFQMVHGVERKEYSILLPLIVLGAWLGWTVAAGRDRRWTWSALAATEGLAVLLSLPSIYFWAGLALTQIWLRGWKKFPWVRWAISHLPAAGVAVLTVICWPSGYSEGFMRYGESIRNNAPKLAADVVFYVQIWLWTPPGWALDDLKSSPIIGDEITAAHLLLFLLRVAPWVVGSPVLALALVGMLAGMRRRERDATRWCAALAVLPVILYVIVFLAKGRPNLFHPRAFLPATPFFYALLGAGVATLPNRRRYFVAVPAMLLISWSAALLMAGLHPDQLPPARPALLQLARKVKLGQIVLVYPSEVYPYVRALAPESLQPSLRPTTNDPTLSPGGWVPTLFDPGLIEDRSAWAQAETRWLAVVPWALHWKDPELDTVRNGPVAWELVHSQINLNLYRRKE